MSERSDSQILIDLLWPPAGAPKPRAPECAVNVVREPGRRHDVTSYRQSGARLVPAVDEEVLIEEPTEPPEVLAGLGRLPSGRSIPAVAALLADRRRR